uniref:Fibronectin type-III domain-containing protein n=1 Tax=Scylla olivacea TaxID=85551 RepID=A0A0P4VTQ1_SCYOL
MWQDAGKESLRHIDSRCSRCSRGGHHAPEDGSSANFKRPFPVAASERPRRDRVYSPAHQHEPYCLRGAVWREESVWVTVCRVLTASLLPYTSPLSLPPSPDVRGDDAGRYWCVASSPRGVTEAGAFISLAAPGRPPSPAPDPATAPRPPATPTVRVANETAAVVEWAAPGGEGGVTGYTLEYYSSEEDGGAAWRVAAAHTPHTTFTLGPLRPAATYGVTVRAHNAHGVSEPSGIAEVGVGGGWVVEEDVEVAGGLTAARVVLQEARPVPPRPAAKILWQVSK